MRRLRRALGEEQRAAADNAICRNISALGAYRQARTLAVFMAFDGEPSLARLASAAAKQGKRVYAPVLLRRGMCFAPLVSGAALAHNCFGIDEPHGSKLIDPRALDLVLTPLVAFDRRGARLGVGRGYYDRAFRFLGHRVHWSRPKLLGVAYSFQLLDEIELNAWDVPLWGAVTESQTFRFAAARS
jgi:5-formyltetrahydrofolate cyclo-ligase